MLEGLAREGSFRWFLDKQSSFNEKLDTKAFSNCKYSYFQMLKLSLYFVRRIGYQSFLQLQIFLFSNAQIKLVLRTSYMFTLTTDISCRVLFHCYLKFVHNIGFQNGHHASQIISNPFFMAHIWSLFPIYIYADNEN